MAAEGLEKRLLAHVFGDEMDEAAQAEAAKPYRDGLDFELGVVIEMGFAGYFLIVADFIQWAKREGIPVGPGRGSGAGSLVAWALEITDLDPLRFGLLFERFLNPERVSMPDFDIDFCQDQRDRVIRYVQEKYGHDQVAQIITFGKLQARAVLRDVGRVLAMPYGQVDRLSKLVPYNPANPVSLEQALEAEPRLVEERRQDPTVARLIDVAMKLEGLYRHASTHAAGVVIGDRPLDQLVPLYRDPRSDMPVTQFNMKWVEPAGLVKFDFLGLKTLTVLDRTVKMLAERGVEIDLDRLALDDAKTYELLQRAETIGVFQFESSGMRDLLRESEPTNIEDLIALVALYRPGPMENIPKYIACKHGRERPEFLHETIEPVVKDTYGVIIYQEQVMQIAQVFAGYTLGQADLLRRAMGKKIKAEMAAQRDDFVEGAMAREVSRERAVYVFDLVDKFAGYGFNKAHSAGYALLAYQTAYLKANYPVEFLAASMTLDLGNTDKLNVYRQELDRLAIPLLPPDINKSDVTFAVERDEAGQGAIRYALAAIRNVGREAMRALVAERRQDGSFTNLWDFARRMDHRQVNKRQLENLARAGAFDGLVANRAQVLAAVDLMLRFANHAAEERESQQTSLFQDANGESQVPAPPLPVTPEWSETVKLGHEFDAVGFYLSAHPLDAYGGILEKARVIPYAELEARLGRGGNHFKLAGTVLAKRERNSARGNRYAFVQLSDPSGMYEVTAFSEILLENRELFEPGVCVVLTVEAREKGDGARLTVQKVAAIESVSASNGGDLKIFLKDESPLQGIKGLLGEPGQGRSEVHLLLQIDTGREVELALPGRFALSPEVRGALKAVAGVVDVHEI
jgi:DNA polymerase-3 subunit alpha